MRALFSTILMLTLSLPTYAEKTPDPESGLNAFRAASQVRQDLERDLELALEKHQRLAHRMKAARDRPDWYDLGGRLRRDRALRSLRESQEHLRELRTRLEAAWARERDLADPLRRLLLENGSEELEKALVEHDRSRLDRLEQAFAGGEGDEQVLKEEIRYRLDLQGKGLRPEENAGNLKRLRALRPAGLDE